MEALAELSSPIWFMAKLGLLLFLLIYILFAGVVIKQVKVMIATLEVGFERQIELFSYLHFLVSISVFILAIFIL